MKVTKAHHETVHNVINWFEIPVTNMERASRFYSAVLGVKIDRSEMGPYKMGIIHGEKNEHGCGIGGALVESAGFTPSDKGTVLYLNANPDLSEALSKIEQAGGQVVKPKFSIGEHGYIAFFQDTEGNKLALHSME